MYLWVQGSQIQITVGNERGKEEEGPGIVPQFHWSDKHRQAKTSHHVRPLSNVLTIIMLIIIVVHLGLGV